MKKTITKEKVVRLAITGSVLAVSVVLGFNCAPFAGRQAPSEMASESPLGIEPQLSVALMSSEQILKAMISATGTESLGAPTADDELISSTYTLRSGSLPSENSLKLATGPMLISVTNLASAVCNKAVNRDVATAEAQRASRLFFKEIDFSKGLSGQSSDSVTPAFERLARNAWRRDASNAEVDAIIEFAQEFSDGANANDPQQTRLMAVSICTAVLSSIDALTY
ncbi:MAG TPA: hypothetical protein VM432_08635 [Bdellovibrionales bacterium]|nr:hypothetical protein [Bdellovibrionales bacterium]